jgi:benzoate 4-monooxygenase
VRISPNHISLTLPEAIAVVHGHNGADGSYPKSPFYQAFVAGNTPSIFSTQSRTDHTRKRRILSHAFSYSALLEFSPLIEGILKLWTEKLDGIAKEQSSEKLKDEVSGPIDLRKWLNYLSFDVLS